MEQILEYSKAIIELVFPTVNDMQLVGKYGLGIWTYVLVLKLLSWMIVIYTIRLQLRNIGKTISQVFKKIKSKQQKKTSKKAKPK